MLRVVSLLPSATEMLACIVAKQPNGRLGTITFVGRSHECDWPKEFVEQVPTLTSQKTHFNAASANPAKDIHEQVSSALSGGNSLYNLDIEQLQLLNPDVILTQSLCDVCSIDLVTVERVVKRMKMPAKVLDLNPKTLNEVIQDLIRVGEMIGCEEGAQAVVEELQKRILNATNNKNDTQNSEEDIAKDDNIQVQQRRRPNIGFIEWTDPIFVGGHWTPEIITLAGGMHPLNTPGGKSIALEDEQFSKSDPDIVIISPCGMNLEKTRELVEIIQRDEKRKLWFESLRAFKENKIVLVDGNEMFNRPGPRLVDALEFCSSIIESYKTLGKDEPFNKLQIKPKSFPWAPL